MSINPSNLDTKVLEIRDAGTHIPAIAIRMLAKNNVQNYYFRRLGFPPDGSAIGLLKMDDLDGNVDPYAWTGARTMGIAHHFIYDHFDELSDGDVVDVEYIAGLKPTKKISERLTDPDMPPIQPIATHPVELNSEEWKVQP